MEICKRARQLLVVCSQKESRGGGRREVVVGEAWDGMQSEQSWDNHYNNHNHNNNNINNKRILAVRAASSNP